MEPDWKKIGARSRKRGYRLEKHVEEVLNWQRIPASGKLGSAFGKGDVIDGYINGEGYWLAECKMRTAESVSVDGKWIERAVKDGETTGRFVLMIVGIKHAGRNSKRPETWVILSAVARDLLWNFIARQHKLGAVGADVALSPDDVLFTKTTSKSGGFCVRRSWLDKRPGIERVQIDVQHPDLPTERWLMVSLEYFRELVHTYEAYVPNTHREE